MKASVPEQYSAWVQQLVTDVPWSGSVANGCACVRRFITLDRLAECTILRCRSSGRYIPGVAGIVRIEVDKFDPVHVLDELPTKLERAVRRVGKLQVVCCGVEQLQDLLVVDDVGLCLSVDRQEPDRIDHLRRQPWR